MELTVTYCQTLFPVPEPHPLRLQKCPGKEVMKPLEMTKWLKSVGILIKNSFGWFRWRRVTFLLRAQSVAGHR